MSQSQSQSSVNFIQPISMYNRKDLSKMSKDELINMLMGKQTASANLAGPVFKPKSLTQLAAEKLEQSIKRPAVLPKQSNRMPTLKTLAANAMVKDKIKFFEELSDKQAPTIRLHKKRVSLQNMQDEELKRARVSKYKQQSRPQPIPASRTKKQQPVAAPSTKIGEKQRVLKGFTKSYEIGLKTDRDALVQLQNTRLAISRLFNTILNNTKGFKFVETLKVTFVKRKDDDNIYKPAYVNSKAQIAINPNDFLSSLQLSQQQILNGIGVWLSEGSGWTVSSIDEHFINTVVYEPMRGNSYIPLPVNYRILLRV